MNLTSTNINLNGQTTFDTPPHSVEPIFGNDLTTKGYVDSLVGQYSGGFNLYLNYSQSITVNSITYKKLSQTVSSELQQSISITTNGTQQLIASFISDAINITEIPAGLWSLVLYGGVSSAGGILYYFFKIKKNSGGVITDITISGNSGDINATPSTNPTAYYCNATINTPITVLLTDRIIIEIYCIKTTGTNVNLITYFESSYYSYVQTTLNAGTTLLSSNNNWNGTNNFTQIPTTTTATLSDNSTKLATTAYVDSSITASSKLGTNNIWSGTNNFLQIPTTTTATLSDNSTKLATTAYVDSSITASAILGTNNVWSGTNNFTQIPTTTTATLSDNSTKLATTAYVDSSITTNNTSSNAYLTINTSVLPYTIPTLTKSNTYIYITGTLNSGGAIRIPTGTTTTGAFINFRNFTNLNLNLTGSTFLLYSRLETALPPYVLNAGASASFYYNGTIWVQTTTDRTMLVLDVVNQLSVGTYLGDTISTKNLGNTPELYGNLLNTDLNIAKTLPSPYTVRIANTTAGASGGLVNCSNINFNDSNINNATLPDTGAIKLGNSLTSGQLYVGCDSTATHTTGPILIGCDSTASGGIGIGLNTTTLPLTVNTISIGSSTYATKILGTLATLGITSASGGITATTGDIQSTAGNLIAPTIKNLANTGSISSTGTITGTSLVLGTGAITTVGAITSTGTITGSSLVLGTGAITTVGNITSTGTITGSSLVLGTGAITTVGNITSSGNITASTGDIQATAGNLIAPTIRNLANSASISSTGVINASSMTTPSLTTATATALSIGTSLATSISIGASAIATTINGALTASLGLTLASSKYITTSHSGTITLPTATQVGGIINGIAIGTLPSTTGRLSSIAQIDLTAGVWIINLVRGYNNSNLSTRILFSYGTSLRSNDVPNGATDYLYGFFTPTLNSATNYANITTPLSLTSATTIYSNVTIDFTTAPSFPSTNFSFFAVRIA